MSKTLEREIRRRAEQLGRADRALKDLLLQRGALINAVETLRLTRVLGFIALVRRYDHSGSGTVNRGRLGGVGRLENARRTSRHRSTLVLSPGRLVRRKAPPDCPARPWTMDRPRPVPWPTSLVVKKGSTALVVKKGSTARESVASSMSVPVSATVRQTNGASGRSAALPSSNAARMVSSPPSGIGSRLSTAKFRAAVFRRRRSTLLGRSYSPSTDTEQTPPAGGCRADRRQLRRTPTRQARARSILAAAKLRAGDGTHQLADDPASGRAPVHHGCDAEPVRRGRRGRRERDAGGEPVCISVVNAAANPVRRRCWTPSPEHPV